LKPQPRFHWPRSAASCLPRKLARLVLATQEAALGGASVACALADMFPRDIAPLVDMSGKKWAHTVPPRLTWRVCEERLFRHGIHAFRLGIYLTAEQGVLLRTFWYVLGIQ